MIKLENKRRYLITNHLRERYSERVLNLPYTGRLSEIDNSNLVKLLYSLKEEKSWVNNLNIVHYLRKKYGSDKIVILKHNEFWFICKESEIRNHYVVVTVYDSTKSIWNKSCVNKSKKLVEIKSLRF